MKKTKMINIDISGIFRILRTETGDEVFADFRPNTKELQEICKKEHWYFTSEEFYDRGEDILIERIEFYTK